MHPGRELIAPEGAHEGRINPRVSFEMIGNAGARLDFAKEMAEWRRAEPIQPLDEALAPKPPDRRKSRLRGMAILDYSRIVTRQA